MEISVIENREYHNDNHSYLRSSRSKFPSPAMPAFFSLNALHCEPAPDSPGAAHIAHRYRKVCPCCVKEATAARTKPQRRTVHRPELPWRRRQSER
jgi:hypothetical protein